MKPLSVLPLACLLTAALNSCPAFAMPDLVILVRHAEKAADSNDPGLTPEGKERAKALKQALTGLNVNAILTSTARRTQDTAAPLAQHLHLQSQAVDGGGFAGHVKAVAEAVRAQTGVVLVVGHSNTVPAIMAALGAPKLADLCETSFHHVFMLQPAVPPATEPRWAHFSYGAPSGAPGANCL